LLRDEFVVWEVRRTSVSLIVTGVPATPGNNLEAMRCRMRFWSVVPSVFYLLRPRIASRSFPAILYHHLRVCFLIPVNIPAFPHIREFPKGFLMRVCQTYAGSKLVVYIHVYYY